MTRRLAAWLMASALVALLPAGALAHEGHDHKVMGTVTKAASDRVMLRTKEGKDVTVVVTSATRVLRGKQPLKAEEIKAGTRVVVTAVTDKDKDKMKAKTIQVGPDPSTPTK